MTQHLRGSTRLREGNMQVTFGLWVLLVEGQSPVHTPELYPPMGGAETDLELGGEGGQLLEAVRSRLMALFPAASGHHVQLTLPSSCVYPAGPSPGECGGGLKPGHGGVENQVPGGGGSRAGFDRPGPPGRSHPTFRKQVTGPSEDINPGPGLLIFFLPAQTCSSHQAPPGAEAQTGRRT